jgi:hypothetical protein
VITKGTLVPREWCGDVLLQTLISPMYPGPKADISGDTGRTGRKWI